MKTLTTKLFATVGLGTALLLGGCEMPPPNQLNGATVAQVWRVFTTPIP